MDRTDYINILKNTNLRPKKVKLEQQETILLEEKETEEEIEDEIKD